MSEAEMEMRILDFIRRNGESTALEAAKHLGVSRSIANKHLYSLKDSKLFQETKGTRPVWDLIERMADPRPAVKPDTGSEGKEVRELLRSRGKTGLKAHQIARDLGQSRQSVNKHLYSLRDKGQVQKSVNKEWINIENVHQDRYVFPL